MFLRLLALLFGLALIGAACGNGDDDVTTGPEPDGDGAAEEQPGEGVQVTAARANWDTGYFQAEIFKQLLEELGYEVSDPSERELGPDLFYPALAQGEIDFWANGWFPLHEPQLETEVPGRGTVSENVSRVGFEVENGALQGYLADTESVEELGITNMQQIADDPELAAHFDRDGNGQADLIGCNPGWGCEAVINDHIEEFGWGDNIEHVQGEYSALMADTFARAERGEPVLYYTWTPNFTVARLVPGEEVMWLGAPSLPGEDTVAEVDGCAADPCEMGFPPNDIRVVANDEFLSENPAAEALFEGVEIPAQDIFDQNLLMNEGENSAADIERHATEWIEENRDQVDEWLEEARAAA